MIKEKTFKVSGMHCPSCELVIEKKLLALPAVKSVEASTSKGQVVIEYEGNLPQKEDLNKIFTQEKYTFFDSLPAFGENNILPTLKCGVSSRRKNVSSCSIHPSNKLLGILELSYKKKAYSKTDNSLVVAIGVVLLAIVGFVIFNSLGLSGLVNVNQNSSLLLFLGLGLIAGISSCAALVGGIILSMSKQWLGLYSQGNSTSQKLQPHFLFNFGRIVSYALFGALLGLIGNRLQISFAFTSFLVIAVSILMFFLGLQMLGVKYFQKFQITLPKTVTRYVAEERNFKGRYLPFFMGAMTFFLPCGFTLTAQGMALLSGNPWQAALIMLAFVLGTTPSLLVIGLSSVKLAESHRFSSFFPKVAGALVLFFAFYNLNSQLNVLGVRSLSDWRLDASSSTQKVEESLAPIMEGKQVIKMVASASFYQPNYFRVKAGVPVRWEITDEGTSGCTNAVISRGLFEGQIDLTPGQVSVKEFIPQTPGKYKFSCWMGMISGVIEVVGEESGKESGREVVSSGASGCGCRAGGQ